MSAPDRIMASVDFEQIGRVKVKTSCVTVGVKGIPDPFDPAGYLLSTTPREHADELVEALRRMVDMVPFGDEPAFATDLLAKIKEASNE